MKNLTITALLALSLSAIGTAGAQTHADHSAHAATPAAAAVAKANPNARLAAEFAKFDRNADKRLTRREMAKHPMLGHFKMMDLNRDGYISFAEYSRKH